MRLGAEEQDRLIRAAEGSPIEALVGDACELLTFKVILFIRRRMNELREVRDAKPADDFIGRSTVQLQRDTLAQLSIDLAKAP
ncbi:MAG: hypothetical protein K2X82_08320 [Gemmataceae bacterium]|nr:hypothetical protein [Gemmataceae bacterium]